MEINTKRKLEIFEEQLWHFTTMAQQNVGLIIHPVRLMA